MAELCDDVVVKKIDVFQCAVFGVGSERRTAKLLRHSFRCKLSEHLSTVLPIVSSSFVGSSVN